MQIVQHTEIRGGFFLLSFEEHQMDLSTHFNQEALSDVVLRVRSTLGDHARNDLDSPKRPKLEDGSESERSYYLHKLILCQSLFFLKWLEWPRVPPPSGEPTDALAELHMRMRPLPGKAAEPSEPAAAPSASCAALPASAACASRAELIMQVDCELEVFELLLKCLYKVELPEEARGHGQLLLRVYRLEDAYKIPAACMEPVLAALSAIQVKDIDIALLSHVYSLPEAVSLQKIAAASRQRLVELFGDVPAVIMDLEQRRQFCTLPHAAVLAWLQFDNLKVHSESCVLLLLTAWVRSKDHPACSYDELTQLAHSVRVKHLSGTYLHGVLPDLKWFQRSCSKEVKFLRGMHVQKATGGNRIDWEGPAAWIAPKRKETSMPASAAVNWSLGPEELRQLYTSATDLEIISPGSTYLNGVFYKLSAAGKGGEAKGGMTFGVNLTVDEVEMEAMLGFWDCDNNPVLFKAELWVADRLEGEVNTVSHSLVYGFNDILGRSAATLAELVAPLLVGGYLSLKAVIKAA